MNTLSIDVDKLLKISAGLPHGATRRIALKVGCSEKTVSQYRNGKIPALYNQQIVDAIMDEYKEKKGAVSETNERMNQLIK